MCKLVIKPRVGMCILKKLRQKVTVQGIKRINICKKAVNRSKISKKFISSLNSEESTVLRKIKVSTPRGTYSNIELPAAKLSIPTKELSRGT
jgi:hypothetical protein